MNWLSDFNQKLVAANDWMTKQNRQTWSAVRERYADLMQKLGWSTPDTESDDDPQGGSSVPKGIDGEPLLISVDGRRPAVCKPPRQFPPLENLIGNADAVSRLTRGAFDAWTKTPRSAADLSLAFIGPASSGKTTCAAHYSAAVCLPFVEIQPQEVLDIGDIYVKIREAVDGAEVLNPLTGETEHFECIVLERDENHVATKIILPPCVVFIDEVHRLRPKIVQGGLLKACEHSDRSMMTEDGIFVDTSHVCWIVATTERGKLFSAFETRFSKVSLRLYSEHETAQILKLKYPKLPDAACLEAAHYCRSVPREAMAFAREMIAERKLTRHAWEDCAAAVARDNGIDEYGMTLQRLQILTILAGGPVPKNRLAVRLGVKPLELERFILPPLQSVTPDQPDMLVSVCPKGFCLTPASLAELDKRDIDYDRETALAGMRR